MEFEEAKGGSLLEEAISKIRTNERLIICGDIEAQELLEENIECSEETTDSILENALEISSSNWFLSRKEEYKEDFGMDEAEVIGVWPQNISHQSFVLDKNISTNELLEKVAVAKIVVNESWAIPAIFKYGGWNECPDPEVHCSIWKYWQSKYDAHIIGISNDTIEAKVFNPPATKEQAMELAWEQYLYCSDIVDQGVESISNLAASLLNHDKWFFWWD
ncbi:hypothetical protein MNBD_GAMMA10-273 [hydrothermal vent metagenome]|uniref:DUF4253 domain-containing protein n=1 Tax=hydrothermal vent metagenome TaxID=652676 RepID=A0A3B0YL04_9ZZZZ